MSRNILKKLSIHVIPALLLVSHLLTADVARADQPKNICGLVEGPCERPVLAVRPIITYVEEMGLWNVGFRQRCPAIVPAPAKWTQLRKWAVSRIESPKIRAISRWALREMGRYVYGPGSLKETDYKILGCDGEMMLLESTLDTLPSHHPLVTRWLKLFVITEIKNPLNRSHLIVTIQGERLE